jgi:hypothetical protein
MAAHRFQIVVEGELGDRYASAFEGMTVDAHDGLTDLTGSIVDQAHMQGLLARIAGLGLAVHSLTPLDDDRVGRADTSISRSQQHRPGATQRDRES